MRLLQTYFRFVPAGRRRLGLVISLTVAGALFQGASVGLLIPALQIVGNQGALESSGRFWRTIGATLAAFRLPVTLPILLAGVLALIVVAQALLYLQQHVSAAMTRDLVIALRKYTFHAFMRADMSFHHTARTGPLVSSLTQDIIRTGTVFENLLQLISRAILIALYAAMLFVVSWQTALSAVGLVAGASALVYYQVRWSRRLGQQMVEANNQLYGFAVERLGAARLVKLRNAIDRDTDRFWQIGRDMARLRCQHERAGARIRFLMEPALAAGGVAGVYLGSTFFHMSLVELAVFMYVLVRIVPEAYAVNRSRYVLAGYTSHFHSVMEQVARAQQRTTVMAGSRSFNGLRQGIVFKDVTFGYDPAVPVLQHADLTLEAGCFTAIVGASGAGKSTVLDLIARLVEPQSGVVLLDGVDIREYEVTSLRAKIGMVSQDVVLFNDTVLENIRYGCPDASEDEVTEAAIRANAHQFIQALPQGYDTLLGPRGMTLSGGERQRLELARALLGKPSILLLDEATSGLDAESERLIQESVLAATHGRTVIVVTHRLSTVRRAHKVVVIAQGRVVEEGTPEVLLENDGLFRRYHNLQFEEAEPKR